MSARTFAQAVAQLLDFMTMLGWASAVGLLMALKQALSESREAIAREERRRTDMRRFELGLPRAGKVTRDWPKPPVRTDYNHVRREDNARRERP